MFTENTSAILKTNKAPSGRPSIRLGVLSGPFPLRSRLSLFPTRPPTGIPSMVLRPSWLPHLRKRRACFFPEQENLAPGIIPFPLVVLFKTACKGNLGFPEVKTKAEKQTFPSAILLFRSLSLSPPSLLTVKQWPAV